MAGLLIQLAASVIGFLAASYYAIFRIDAVRAKYGSLDLINWFYYVVIAWQLAGWIVAIAVSGIEYAFWPADAD